MPADLIRLTGLQATGFHGVLEQEKRDGQEFVVDLVIETDLAPAGASDDLVDTLHYGEVAEQVVSIVSEQRFDLIEALAAAIADAVLARPAAQAVQVTVHKPQAPIDVPFADVEVVIRREKDVPVVIALGANLERPDASVAAAGHRLRRIRGLRAVRMSALHTSAPVGGAEQPDYVNAVALARTRLTPASLLAELHRIEDDFGRTRQVRWGPRTLDLDLVQYGDPSSDSEVISDDPDLTLPHPRAHERAFVLVPWLDVDPDAVLRVGNAVVRVDSVLDSVASDDVRPLERS